MKRRRMTALCAAVALAAVFILLIDVLPKKESAAEPDAGYASSMPGGAAPSGKAASAPDKAASAAQSAPLFPTLTASAITSLSVTAGDRSFQFRRNGEDGVSVNGQMADEEIFTTLLDQILTLPVTRCAAFTPDEESVLLTLVVTASGSESTVRFYEGNSQETAHVLAGSQDAPLYGSTKAWRIGTLLLTCDGTRIQDESGNETPVN